MTQALQLSLRRAFAIAALAVTATYLTGCHRGDERSAAEIKAEVVDAMLKGVKQPGMTITVSADRYDPEAQELHGVHVNGKQGLLYADRATITVDEQTKAIRMKLFDVIVAQPGDDAPAPPDGAKGHLVKYRELVLEDISGRGQK